VESFRCRVERKQESAAACADDNSAPQATAEAKNQSIEFERASPAVQMHAQDRSAALRWDQISDAL